MAQNFLPTPVSTLTPDALDAAKIQRRQMMAEALLQQSAQPINPQRMSGRFMSAVSPLEGLAKLAEAFIGSRELQRSERQMGDLVKGRNQRLVDALLGAGGAQAPEQIADGPDAPEGPPYSASPDPSREDLYYNAFRAKSSPYFKDPTASPVAITADAITTTGKALPNASRPPELDPRLRATLAQMIDMGYGDKAAELLWTAQQKQIEQENSLHSLGPGAKLTTGGGKVVAENAPAPRSVGGVMYDANNNPIAGRFDQVEGNERVTYEIRGGKPVQVARGAAFNPNPLVTFGAEPTPVADAESPSGVRYVRKDQAIGKAAPPSGAMKPTDSERMAKGYHDRMAEAEGIMSGIGQKGAPTASTAAASQVPIMGNWAERVMMTPEQQQYRQAQEDWVRSKLRKESGAVIAKEEMDQEIRTYFPQIGDSPEVIAQKARARQTAIKAMRDAAGPAISTQEQKAPASGGGALSADEKKELDDLRKRFGKK